MLATRRETHVEFRAKNLVLVSRQQEVHVAGYRVRLALRVVTARHAVAGGGLVLGGVAVGGPVQSHFCAGTQPRSDVVHQADGAVHLVSVEGRVVVVERPERAGRDVHKGITVKLVHRAILVLVGCGLDAFPTARPAVEQAFVEVGVRLTDFRRVEAVVIQIVERYVDLYFLRHIN